MLYSYPAAFFHASDGWTVIFPDLNYSCTGGDTFEEAMKMAIDLMAGYIHTLLMDGETPPKASSLSEITAEAVALHQNIAALPHLEQFVNLVSVDVQEYARVHFERAVKKTLSLPYWLNETAKEKGINFSQVLQKALLEEIKKR